MKHNKHEVVHFHVMDKATEIDFEMGHNPINLIDMETGEKMKLQPAEIKEKYTTEINRYFNEVNLKCTPYNVDFYTVDIKDPIQDVCELIENLKWIIDKV